ncbi:MAG TPA: OmpA family protein [Longimicrobiales bacterium]|nr:OmpA family protein [Longimicrobiales bacterium]
MLVRRIVLATVLATLPLAACSRRQPPVQDTPPRVVTPDTAGAGARRAAELERLRQDSLARVRDLADAAARRLAAEATARARAILEELVHFEYDEAALTAAAQEALARKVPILRANAAVQLRITGHADERGSVEYNLALGMRRAQSARDYLADFGVDPGRISITSMGEDVPLDPASNEAAWARNRRAEFSITAGGATLVMPGS